MFGFGGFSREEGLTSATQSQKIFALSRMELGQNNSLLLKFSFEEA